MKKKSQDENAKKWAEIVAKAWSDEKFKSRLMQNPKAVLEEYGLELPPGSFKVLEDTKNQHFLILPAKPEGHFSETELKEVAAGITTPVLCRRS